jgi:hypothetical protein
MGLLLPQWMGMTAIMACGAGGVTFAEVPFPIRGGKIGCATGQSLEL